MRYGKIKGAALALALGSTAFAQPPEGAAPDGLGGFFFRAEDPEALGTWYFENFGILGAPTSYDELPWMQDAGPTVFDAFPADTTHFAADKSFMLNFRTQDLDGLVAHLQSNGVKVTVDQTVYPNGRFAQLVDPEGNPIQLWEPAE
ncbi:MAG: VOC family protein [Pseudomonadota bacterium]